MKILYICADQEIPLRGTEGCSIHIRSLTDALVDAGHDVTILTAWLGDGNRTAFKARVEEIGATGLDLEAIHLLESEPLVYEAKMERDLRSIFYNVWLRSELTQRFERGCPDVVYERYSLFGWAGADSCRRAGVPHILEVNAPLCVEQEGYDKFTLTNTADEIEAHIFKTTRAIVAVSRWLKEWIVSKDVPESSISVVPNGVAPPFFGAHPEARGVRQRYGLVHKKVIAYLGSFQTWHDVSGLVRAFSEIHADDPTTRLVLIGDGPERRATALLARSLNLLDSVVFTGNVAHQSIPGLLGAVDVMVIPYTRMEDFYFSPLKLYESMASGRPIVAAAIGQIAETIEHGQTGWLYEPGNGDALVTELRNAMSDPGVAHRVGQAARERARAHFAWSTVAQKVVTIANSLRAAAVEGK